MRTESGRVRAQLIGLLVISYWLIHAARAATWYVQQNATGANNGTSWQSAFTNLSTGLAAAKAGDQVWVAAATEWLGGDNFIPWPAYYRPGTTAEANANFQLKAGVQLYGGFIGNETSVTQRKLINRNAAPPQPTLLTGWLDGGPPQSTITRHILRADSNVTAATVVDGFRIDNGGTPGAAGLDAFGGGFLNEGGSPVFRNCTFVSLSADAGSAVYSTGGNPVFVNCVFTGNTAGAAPGGTLLATSGAPAMINCDVVQNIGPTNGFGGVVFPASGTMANSIVWHNGGAGHVIASGPSVTYSVVDGGYPGVGNTAADPQLVSGSDTTIFILGNGSPAIDAGNNAAVPPGLLMDSIGNPRLRASLRPDGSFTGELRVDIGATEAGGVIFVKPGTGFGLDGSSWAKAYNDLYIALTNATATDVRECWVAAGTYRPNDGMPSDQSRSFGSAFSIYGGFSGVETRRDQRVPAANETILAANNGVPDLSTPRIIYMGGNGTIIDGFTVRDGPAGGMYINGNVIVRNCRFISNSHPLAGSAIWVDGVPPPPPGDPTPFAQTTGTIERCTFLNNVTVYGSGAVYFHYANGRVENCLFASNQSYNGGAIFVDSDVDIVNCTMVNNYAYGYGGAIWGEPQVVNCILWGNTAGIGSPEIYGTTPSLTSIIQGGWPGSNLNVPDPGFYDSLSDFRLLSNSPAVDAGTPVSLADSLDLAGNSRALDGDGDGQAVIDIGAYEYGIANQITGVVIGPGGKARVNFVGTTNLVYSIEASTNLLDWTVVGTASYTGPDFIFRDGNAPLNPRRYYRTRLP